MNWKVGAVRIVKIVEHEIPVPLEGLLRKRQRMWSPNFPGWSRCRRCPAGSLIGSAKPATPSRTSGGTRGPSTIGGLSRSPNARYLFARTEWEHWASHDSDYSNVADTVRPVIESGAADLVEVDHRICEEVRLVPAPGHTPGHVCVVVESGDDRAVITGDMSHYPVQFALPDLPMPADSDTPTATRRQPSPPADAFSRSAPGTARWSSALTSRDARRAGCAPTATAGASTNRRRTVDEP